MKKMNHIHKTLLLTGIAATLLAACTKESIAPEIPDVGVATNGLIVLSSSVPHNEVAQSRAANAPQSKATDASQSRAIIDGGTTVDIPALDLYFARADGEGSAGNYTPYGQNAIKATRAKSLGTALTPITWAAGHEQYYQTNGRNTILTAWYPGGATTDGDATGNGYYNPTTQSVTWTINGTQDIMTAPRVTGNKTTTGGIGNIAFAHRLAAVQVSISAESNSAQTAWGNVTKVAIRNQRTLCTYNLADDATGAVSFKGSATTNFMLYDGVPLVIPVNTGTNTGNTIPGAVLIEPQPSTYTLQLAITTTNGGTQYIYLPNRELNASTKYIINVKFTQTTITLSATIVPWATPVNEDVVVDGEGVTKVAAVGDYYYTDGTYSTQLVGGKTANGLIFDIDPANPKKYKVMGLYETPNPTTSWANSISHCNTYTGVSGANNPFGTWRLPNNEELQHLYCAINNASPTTWPQGNTGAPTPNTTAFANWNSRLKAISATEIVSRKSYWSSTESTSGNAHILKIEDGTLSLQQQANYAFFRCIRNVE